MKLPELWRTLAVNVQGQYQYCGVSGNFERIKSYYQETERQAYKWLNRRSQKQTWNWDGFRNYLATVSIARSETYLCVLQHVVNIV